MREVLSYLNQCNRCGVPVKHVRLRAWHAEKMAANPNLYKGEEVQPPDAPEELLFSKDSKKLREALATLDAGRQ